MKNCCLKQSYTRQSRIYKNTNVISKAVGRSRCGEQFLAKVPEELNLTTQLILCHLRKLQIDSLPLLLGLDNINPTKY
jgi:hypothetical protein